jgi:hypothetical protein
MQAERPQKTLADYLVIGVSPVLIMLLVWSLVFFLIQVFYRGEGQASVSWVMFWFVMAVVLICRIGMEQGANTASLYGLALAAATWLYLVRTHPAYLLGAALLGIVWWSAHKLTWDCTLIDDDQDASGHGLLSLALNRERVAKPQTRQSLAQVTKRASSMRQRHQGLARRDGQPHPPGLWVVYFSLAALPLFGIGQVLLPADDPVARRRGFAFLVVYLVAALGLLLATSFLGLRRYLRQRYLTMPPSIAVAWLKTGSSVVLGVVAVALLIPKPGADYTWKTLAYHVDHQLRRATELAARVNPQGEGSSHIVRSVAEQKGRSVGESDVRGADGAGGRSEGKDARRPDASGQNSVPGAGSPPRLEAPAPPLYPILRNLLVVFFVLWLASWLYRRRHFFLEGLRSFGQTLIRILNRLFGYARESRLLPPASRQDRPAPKLPPLAAYRNPFISGKDRVWSPEQLIAYTFDAVQAWAREHGIERRPEQTPREFCQALSQEFPPLSAGLEAVAYLYAHVAYGRRLPADPDWETVRRLWRHISESTAVAA